MGNRRGFRSIPGGSRSRRRTGWEEGPFGVLSPASTAISVFPTAQTSLVDGQTIVRTRGELLLLLLSAAAPQQGFEYAAGLCIVSAKAFSVGATAIPGPITDMDWDGWYWHTQGEIKAFASGTFSDIAAAARIVVDSKAMRKFEDQNTAVGVLEVTEVGTATMHAGLRTRHLLKLP